MELQRDVKIEKYWSPVIGKMRDFQEIAKGENPEFKTQWDAVMRFIEDCFVHTGSVWAIERWERIFGIETFPADPLDVRRARILAVITRKVPYTMRALFNMLEALVGAGNFHAAVNNVTSTLTVLVNVEQEHKLAEIESLLKAIVPANMGIVLGRLYSPHSALKKYTHAELSAYTHKYIKEQLEV